MYVILYHTILIGVWLGDPWSHHSEGKFGLKMLTLNVLVLKRVFPTMLKFWLSTYCQLCLILRCLLLATAHSQMRMGSISLTKRRSMALDVCLYIHHANCMSSLVHACMHALAALLSSFSLSPLQIPIIIRTGGGQGEDYCERQTQRQVQGTQAQSSPPAKKQVQLGYSPVN